MKKILLPILLAAMLFTAVLPSLAEISFKYNCYDQNCQEGTKIDYLIFLSNTFNKTLLFNQLLLMTPDKQMILEFDTGDAVGLNPGDSHLYNLTREVKATPDGSYTLSLKVCWNEVKVFVTPTQAQIYSLCSPEVYNIPILSLNKIKCNSTDQCAEKQECIYFDCKPIVCPAGQYAKNHQCTALDCRPYYVSDGASCRLDDKKAIATALVIVFVLVAFYFVYKAATIKNSAVSKQGKKEGKTQKKKSRK